MPFGFHPTELIIVLILALVIFGPKRLPEIGSAMGKGLREFRKATSEMKGQIAEPALSVPSPALPPVAVKQELAQVADAGVTE